MLLHLSLSAKASGHLVFFGFVVVWGFFAGGSGFSNIPSCHGLQWSSNQGGRFCDIMRIIGVAVYLEESLKNIIHPPSHSCGADP